jgi:DNA-binding SARP family transcriptional activator/WD40 repeat protein/tRNA A-37 threonylcarbamoyl transferase component Bud32
MGVLRFSVLGPVGAAREGASVALGGPQQRRVLAVLVADAGRVVPIDRLVDAMWGGEPPDHARRTAMSYLSRLRTALGTAAVDTVGSGYRLAASDGAVDAAWFEGLLERARLAPASEVVSILGEALALWRGPAYGEFCSEWWAIPHATRLEELRLVAAEDRIEAMLSLGDISRATSDLEGLVAANPLRDRLVAQLMRAHEAAGRQHEALRTFQAYRDRLADETGLEPGPALVQLEREILEGDVPTPAPAGRSLRGYQLGEVLGQGAFGTVYRSVQPGIGREVAVKVIRSERADSAAFVRRFEAEAQLVAHLEHPHVVPLYDFWREPGGAYLVFRLLRGGSVAADVERGGAWPVARATRLIEQIGGALAVAHGAGIVHRDVKPSNVLLDLDGNAYLGDFGIAAGPFVAPGRPGPASPRSPIYSPPEQLEQASDPSVDQYSLAVVVHELLTGAPMFAGESDEDVARAKVEGSPALSDADEALPAAVADVLRRATAGRPEERYPDVSAFVAAWRRAVGDDELSGDAGGTGSRSARVPGSRPDADVDAGVDLDVPNPYLGLRAYGAGDARHFRGRSALTDALLAAVTTGSFVMVAGASGSGKSSLLHAGLVPRLRAAGDRVVSMVPGDDPLAQLRLALLAVARREPRGDQAAELVRAVAAEGGALTLVIDQFEELWTLTAEQDRRRFVRSLVELATEVSPSPVRIAVAVRADFYDRPLAEPLLAPLAAASTFAVTPMTAAELHDAIVGPASSVGVELEPSLVSQLISETADQPAGLPLLQFTLTEIFERRTGPVIEQRTYEEVGGLGGAIASRAEALLANLEPADVERVRHLMLRLVVPGDGTEDTRRRVRRSELPPGTGPIADHLERDRLLVGDRDPSTREPTVEVAHESLLRSWPRLQTWLGEDRDSLRALRHLAGASEAWADAGRADSELYRGARLEVASDLAANRPEELSAQELGFVVASRARADADAERDRRARRRLRHLLTGTAAALALALVAGLVALIQRGEAVDQRQASRLRAEEAEVAGLVSLSQSLAPTKRDVAALLAMEASRRAPGAATDSALMTAAFTDPTFLGDVRIGGSHAGQLAVTPDGRILFANPQVDGEQPRRIDVRTRKSEVIVVPGQDDRSVYTLAAADDHRLLVTFENVFSGGREQAGTRSHAQAQELHLVDIEAARSLADVDLGGLPTNIAVGPGGHMAAVTVQGTDDLPPRVEVFETDDLHHLRTWTVPSDKGAGASWYGASAWLDADRVATGSPGGEIDIWRPSSGALVHRLNVGGDRTWPVSDVLGATKDGKTLFATRGSQEEGAGLMAFDVASGRAKWDRPKAATPLVDVDERSGTVFAQEAGYGSSRLFGYGIETGERTGRTLDLQHGTACDAAVVDAGRTLAVSSCNEGSVGLWSLDGSNLTSKAAAPFGWGTGSDLWGSTGWLATWDEAHAGPLVFENQRTGRRVESPVKGDYQGIFLRDGRLVALPFDGKTVTIADLDRGGSRHFDIDLPEDISFDTASDARSRYVVTTSQWSDVVVVIDVKRGRMARRFETGLGPVHGAAFSKDGRWLYLAGQQEEAIALDLATGQQVGRIPFASNITISPDGKLLATSSFDGAINFYDPKTFAAVGAPLSGATAFTPVFAFTPDSRLLVTLSLDQTVRVWDVASRRQLGPGIAAAIGDFNLSPDSKTLVLPTEVGVQRFALDRASLRRAACRAADRNLSDDEWRRYIGGTPKQLC